MKGSAGTARAAGASARSTLIVAFAIATIVFVLDQLSKLWAENTLEHNVAQPLVGDILKLRLIYNSGAAFGLGGSITPIITGVQIGIALAVVFVLVRSVRSRAWAISLSLLLGGALGNIVDRLFRDPGPLTVTLSISSSSRTGRSLTSRTSPSRVEPVCSCSSPLSTSRWMRGRRSR